MNSPNTNKVIFSNSYLQSIDGIDYLNLREDNYYKTGLAYGTLLIKSENKLIFFFKNFISKIIFSIFYFLKNKELHTINVPQKYQEELKGISESTGIKYEHLLLVNLYYEMGCSGFIFFNPNGSLLVGHNTDTMKLLANFLLKKSNPLVVSISIPSKNTFTTVSLPGFIGVANGFNNNGIAISSHDVGNLYWKKVPDNTSASCVLRMILENANNLDDVMGIAKDNPAYYPGLMIIASEKENKSGILELYPTDFNFTLTSKQNYTYTANHYHSEKMKKYHKEIELGSVKRYEFLSKILSTETVLDVGKAITILKDTTHGIKRSNPAGYSVANDWTFQSFVFDVGKGEVYISNGRKPPVSLHGGFVKITTK